MKKGKLAGAIALFSAMGVAAAAPAGAGVHATPASQAAFCDPLSAADARVFGNGTAALGRGGIVREPELNQVHQDMPAAAKGKAGRNFKVTVPVYFHVITDGAAGALTNAADRRADRRAQQHVRGRRGRRRDRLQLQARRRHPDRQRGLVRRRTPAARTSTR